MPKSPWPRVSQKTLADQAYEAIRSHIASGDLAVGEFIREHDVSAALGVSRTPVREALGRLASEGFIERIPHRGFRVPVETVATLLELYPILSSLELLAGKLALPHLKPSDLRRLHEINTRMEACMKRGGTVDELVELNSRFHDHLCRRSGNERLRALLHDLRSQVKQLENWFYSDEGRSRESVAHHRELLLAIQDGEHSRVLDLIETNMALTYERFSEEHAEVDGEFAEVDSENETFTSQATGT